jgi:hypothetical protein
MCCFDLRFLGPVFWGLIQAPTAAAGPGFGRRHNPGLPGIPGPE